MQPMWWLAYDIIVFMEYSVYFNIQIFNNPCPVSVLNDSKHIIQMLS